MLGYLVPVVLTEQKSSMMKFLKSFFLTLRERFSKTQSPHNLKATVDDNEKLARYIFSASHFSRKASRVKAEAYMPSRGEVSVFRIDGLDQASIGEIGSDIAKLKLDRAHRCGRPRLLHG